LKNQYQQKPNSAYEMAQELAEQFDDKNVAIVRSYINKKKITEDVLEALKQAAQ